jgi:hypothetical protein
MMCAAGSKLTGIEDFKYSGGVNDRMSTAKAAAIIKTACRVDNALQYLDLKIILKPLQYIKR